MGRSFWFECSKCGYRATVSGGADRGRDLFVQTIVCRDCRKLYDAVTRLRVPLPAGAFGSRLRPLAAKPAKPAILSRQAGPPPPFATAVNRLPCEVGRRFRWLRFKLQCPASPFHRVVAWNEPAKCPGCGLLLDKNALPYRLWD